MHRTDGNDEERQQRHQRGEATEEHRPTDLLHCFYDSLATFTVYAHPSSEIREDVDVVGDGHRKRQNGGNHQYR